MRRKRMIQRAGFVVVAPLLFGGVAQAGETVPVAPPPARIPTYTVQDLGTLEGYERTQVESINEASEVAGVAARYVYRDGLYIEYRAFIGDELGLFDVGTSEVHSGAEAINNSGAIAGWNRMPDSWDRAFLYDNGQYIDLGTLNGDVCCSQANDINDANQVVGWSQSSRLFAFLWQDGVMIDLGSLYNKDTQALAINNFGVVVGTSDIGVLTPPFHYARAFLWQNGIMTELPGLGMYHTVATDINDFAFVIGRSDGYAVGWVDYQMEYLADPPSSLGGNPLAVNNSKTVVGQGGTAQNPVAVLWKDRVRYNLNALAPPSSPWLLRSATDINNKGEIVGYGSHPISTLWQRSFILRPIDCDMDDDGQVALADYQELYGCLTGSGIPTGPYCDPLDFDQDGDVDFVDYRSLELAFEPVTGP